ncbi:nuclear factor of kappa light polypeptide gene enhancer in B-cells inhibitor, alpha b [Gadus morhua]|uniref:nuclear factor of kappa light polypeptide gene enhancer in B-cells inhibitor, alpha b n=1 Tax=Gadus morhua TaxID=8049 RepID=UPI0011B856A7|nr:NF-kappa-B inhibitor alpha [Gadus morhua]
MDLDRVFSQMDYIGGDAKEAKSGVGTTEDRLDSGLDSLKDEEYQAVTAELTQLRVECSRPQQKQPTSVTGDEHKWREQITEDGDTLLHLSIIHEAKDYIKNMIDSSRNTHFLNTQNILRQTPLHLAVITGQADVCERLLLAGADPTAVDDRGDTALHIACRGGNLLCFSVLTQNCPSEQLRKVISTCNYKGLNCLHLTCVHGFLSLVESLVALGADINAQEQCNGRSALHLAVDLQSLSLVRLLLRGGADPNHVSYGGFSPFHLTYGRHDNDIRNALFPLTDPSLRELPDSEPEDSEDEGEKEEEDGPTDEEVGYDDIQWNGH